MTAPEVQLQTLIDMGLTQRQACVYLYLATSGVSSINAVSKGTGIARQHLYEIIDGLNKVGLVQKQLSHPIKITATSAEIGLAMLMEQKSKAHKKIMENAKELIEDIKTASQNSVVKSKKPDFALISGIKPIVAEIRALHDRAQYCVDCLINWRGAIIAFENASEQYLSLLDNGVKFRMLMDVPPEKNQFEDAVKPLIQHPGCAIKHIPSRVPAFLLIRDGEEILMGSSPNDPLGSPYLHIHNTALVSLIYDYYELMWKTN